MRTSPRGTCIASSSISRGCERMLPSQQVQHVCPSRVQHGRRIVQCEAEVHRTLPTALVRLPSVGAFWRLAATAIGSSSGMYLASRM